MDQRGTADLAQSPPPPSNSGPQEMERTSAVAGLLDGHLWAPPQSASLVGLGVQVLLLPSLGSQGQVALRTLGGCYPTTTIGGFILIGGSPGTKRKTRSKDEGTGRCLSYPSLEWILVLAATLPVFTLLYWMGTPGATVPFALWPLDSLTFWGEVASEVVRAKPGRGLLLEEGWASLRDFCFYLPKTLPRACC